MSLLEQQNFLARIFTDETLRQTFWENPQIVGIENGLDEVEIVQIKSIIPEDLNFFADSLLHKRLNEVEKLLPLTKKILEKDFGKYFREFSQIFQPITVKKHLEDAIEFCKYLQLNKIKPSPAQSTAKFEQTKHEFFGYGKSFAYCFLQHNVFNGQKKLGFAFWYRFGNQTRHFIL
ncbi:MAG: hypothetical protein K1X72_04060 [Pyrinomonadaceae bacterium]|nr:hypothetical protein [Pyrinomonadaceae bacterium]